MRLQAVGQRRSGVAGLLIIVLLGGVAARVDASPGDIHRFAGSAGAGPALAVAQAPTRLAFHSGGLFVSDSHWSVIRRIDLATGYETIAAGRDTIGFSGDGGPATEAELFVPQGIAFDAAGNLYIADGANFRVRRVDAATGIIETVAGSGVEGFSGDGGPATEASLRTPADVAVDEEGNLYIADPNDHRVRRVDALTGTINTVAGTGEMGFSGDGGSATSAQLAFPSAVVLDASGNVLIVDPRNNRIRRVDTAGTISTFYLQNGSEIRDLAVAPDGSLYGTRTSQPVVFRIDGAVGVGIAGSVAGFAGDGGPAINARLAQPTGVTADAAGNLYVADAGNKRVRRIDAASAIITTIAGTGVCCTAGDGRPATDAQFGFGVQPGIDLLGNLLLVNGQDHRVRRIDVRTGIIDAVAGTGIPGFSGDGGQATAASLRGPRAVTGDASGNVFIADSSNARIRRVDHATGIITTIVGTGTFGRTSDGVQARTASIGTVASLTVDHAGNLFFDERTAGSGSETNCSIRRVDAVSGVLDTVAGGGRCGGDGVGDGGPARSARLADVRALAVDPRGALLFIDHARIRRVDFATGTITSIAGGVEFAFTPDGEPAAGSPLFFATGLGIDSGGNVIVAEQDSQRVRRIDAATGLLSTIAGTGAIGWQGYGDGGPATLAELYWPSGLVVAHTDRVYIVEDTAHRIRVIESGPRCGDWVQDANESCDDGNPVASDCCSPACEIESATTVCRPAIGACDVAETCGGSSATCPTDSFVASGGVCNDDGNACTSDVCDGAGTCTHPSNSAPCDDGSFCNGPDTCSAGTCSVHAGDPCKGGVECATSCNELLNHCNVATGLPCQDDDSYCTEDYCDGNGSCIHPAARAGEVCRAAAGDCDVPEVCDGLAAICPNDVFKPATQVCRRSAGACDVAESCTGTAASCPGDAKAPSGTQCLPDSETCTADICDGNGACTHPAGNAGTTCRASAGDCDAAEQCDGTLTSCPTNRFKPATTVCRGSAGECDVAETCSGSGPTCASDTRAAGGTPCTVDALICTADVCDGTSVACTHPAGNVGLPCRAAASACDLAESCDGVAIECPADTGLSDADSDGECDAQDPCTNRDGAQDFVSPPRSTVVLAKVNTDTTPSNDRLTITAYFELPEGKRFADLRPHINGARVIIESADGRRPIDALLPAGAYSAATRNGWTTSRSGKAWTFLDRRATPTNGIVKLTVTDRNRSSTPRQVKVVVTGKNGLYPVAPMDVPVQAIVALGNAADAAAGMCGESAYSSGSCAFNRTGHQLICIR